MGCREGGMFEGWQHIGHMHYELLVITSYSKCITCKLTVSAAQVFMFELELT